MFWWLYYANVTTDFSEKPLVIWLQRGPGASSTGYGNFMELGPLDVDLNLRNHTWVRDYNVFLLITRWDQASVMLHRRRNSRGPMLRLPTI
ncbi:hypothetical protein TKK_0007082 [Trichogramma kaykai]